MKVLFCKLMLAVVFATVVAVGFSLWAQAKAGKEITLLKPLVQIISERQAVPKVLDPGDIVPEIKLKSESKPTPPPLPSAFRIPILMYHYVGDNPNPSDTTRNSLTVPLKSFEEQVQYLVQNGFTPLSLDDLVDIAAKRVTIPAKPVVLTFDDGYIDFYVNAFPVLKKYGLQAAVFIPTGLMNQGYYMSWDQIREISNSGLVSFGAHTVTHRNLTVLNWNEMIAELKNSKEILGTETGQGVNFIAYPFGATNDVVYEAAQSVGFVGGVGTWSGVATNLTMNMPRLRMGGYVTLNFFASLLK